MKIAVCDDDKATREHIISLIKEQIQDAEIVTFGSGEEMLKAQEDFDISFLDVEMKELSGMDVAKQIRQEQEEKGSASLVIISGNLSKNKALVNLPLALLQITEF